MIEEVAALVDATPGRTATELRDLLRARGRVSMTTADVLRVLAGAPQRFAPDDGSPPRWTSGTARLQPSPPPAAPPLHAWQAEALDAWRGQGRRGVVEAVTGTGKTRLGVAAIAAELGAGGQALVLVPTRTLLHQWDAVLRAWLPPGVRVGLRGDGSTASLRACDVVVAVVNSARGPLGPVRPGGLLVADEVHRYASEVNRLALDLGFPHRLGLTATFARPDERHVTWLRPYFRATCFRMGHRRAVSDRVVAPFALALVGVTFSAAEAEDYASLTETLKTNRAILLREGAVRPDAAFFEDVARVARSDEHMGAIARAYLRALQDRRALLAETPAKALALRGLASVFRASARALVFTQTIAGAERAAGALRALGLPTAAVHSELDGAERRAVLSRFSAGELRVVAAPQVLDEGIDVPDADLAVVVAASQSRRQMTQRLGRVLRPKADGREARFVILYVLETVEDPAKGAHEGFLEEVTTVAVRQGRFAEGEPALVAAFLSTRSPR